MDLVTRWSIPQGVIRGERATMVGLLWVIGGCVVAVTGLLDGLSLTARTTLLAGGGGALAVGLVLLAVRRRSVVARFHLAGLITATIGITAVVLVQHPAVLVATAILYASVSTIAFVAYRHRAFLLVTTAAIGHAIALLIGDIPGAAAIWFATWAVATINGLLAGEVVAASRSTIADRELLVSQLRDADAAKTAFLYAVRHELARPATVIAGLAETLAAREGLPESKRAELFERLVRRSRGLTSTLDDLLDLSELSEGTVDLTPQPVELADVIDRAVELAEFDRRRLRLTNLEGRIVADPKKLAFAVANLLTNAAKYTPSDAIVDVNAELRPEIVIIRVEDRGPGVPDGMRWRIFEPFERMKSEHVTLGSGLGLAIVRQFARLHGGDAWVEPRKGGGARFTITIARHDSAEEPAVG